VLIINVLMDHMHHYLISLKKPFCFDLIEFIVENILSQLYLCCSETQIFSVFGFWNEQSFQVQNFVWKSSKLSKCYNP